MQKTFNFFFKKLFYRKPLQNSLLQIIHKRSNTFGTLFTHALHLKCTKTFRLRLILLKIYILTIFTPFYLNIAPKPVILVSGI